MPLRSSCGSRARKARRGKNRADRSRLPKAELHGQDAVRCKDAPRVRCDGAIAVETIRPAVEGNARIEGAHLRFEARNLLARDIRRIADHDDRSGL